MVAKGLAGSLLGGRPSVRQNARQQSRVAFRAQPARAAQAAPADTDAQKLGFNMMRKGIKEASAETVLTPRFYTTDFDEMEVHGASRMECIAVRKSLCWSGSPSVADLVTPAD